jgi:hypothetical protein
MFVKGWLVAVASLVVACSGSTDDHVTTLSACEPLAPITTSVRLDASKVVAAGQAEDGSVYLVYGDNRLFVGSGQSLVERDVIGSGETGTQTDLDYVDDDATPVKVELVRDDAGTHMTVARGMQSSKGIDSGNGESLEPVDAALVASFGARTTKTFQIDFAASLVDGRELVVVAPAQQVDYEQFRVFFGPPAELAQQVVTSFGSARSGQRFGTVTIDGAPADLKYLAGGPSVLNPSPGPSTLTIAKTEHALTEGDVPTDAAYTCFSD